MTLEGGQQIRVGALVLGPRLSKGSVTGYVTYHDHTPVPGATVEYVEIRPESTGLPPLRTRTDARGRFVIELYGGLAYQFTAHATRRPSKSPPPPQAGIGRSGGGGDVVNGELIASTPVRIDVRADLAPFTLVVVER